MEGNGSANSDRLRYARNLVHALECGDAAAELEAVNAILGLHEKGLHANLSRIAADLREALSATQYSSELARLAKSELPGAQQRLNRVIELTQAAADTSLTAVEKALPLIKGIRNTIAQLTAGGAAGFAPMAADAAAIEQCLSDVLLAQGFQDITGQIIRRIVRLVAELEEHLSTTAPPVEKTATAPEISRHGKGPALAGIDANALHDQQDVDELLGQLGL